jgi:hypothetical protein
MLLRKWNQYSPTVLSIFFLLLFSFLSQQLHAQGGTNPTVPNCIILADPVDICVGQSVSFFKFNASGTEDCETIPTATYPVISAEFHPGAGIPPITIPGNPTTGFYFQNVSITYNVPGVYYPYIIFYNDPPYQPTTIYSVEMQNNGPGSNYIPAVITVSDVPVISSQSGGLSFCDNGLNEVVLMNNPIPSFYPNAIELSFQYALPSDNVTVDWGDGNQGNFTVASFNAGIAQVYHNYTGAGLYIIQITVDGLCGSSTFQIPVHIMKLSAMFSFAAGCQGYPVQFDYTNFCFDPQQHLLTWHYGDGNSLTNTTNTTPQHAYNGTGPYVATLTVSDLAGNPLAQWSQSVSLLPSASPQFSPTTLIECEQSPLMVIWLNYNAYVNGVVTSITDPNGLPVNFVQNGNQIEILDQLVQGSYTISINDNNNCPQMWEINVLPCCDADSYTLPDHSTLYGINIPQFQATTVTTEFDVLNTTATDMINQYNFGSNFFSNRVFLVNGTLWIDQNVTFSNCKILMGPNARVILQNNTIVSIRNYTRVFPCDGYMWDGFYADNNSETINVDFAQFYGAKNAIHLSNFAIMKCEWAYFEQNHTGVFVRDYIPTVQSGGASTNVGIDNSRFNFLPNQVLLYPFGNLSRPYAGVHADLVNEFSIGANGGNMFRNSSFGILAENSEIISYNNEFTNHGGGWSNTNQYRPAGITAFGTVPSYWWVGIIQPKVNLVDGSQNHFSACDQGVYGYNIIVDLKDSEFLFCTRGIHINEPKNNSVILNNVLSNGQYGIMVQKVFEMPTKMIIMGNQISNYVHGIRTTNLLSNSNAQLKIQDNTILHTQTNTQLFRTGIRLEACANATVSGNTVSKNGALVAGEYGLLKGIYLSESEGAQVFDNDITRMGQGIYCIGYLAEAQLYCNTIDACNHGVFLEPGSPTIGTVMTHQRTADQAQDNIITNGIDPWQVAGQNNLAIPQYWRRRSNAMGGYLYQFQFGTFNPVSTSNLSCTGADLPPDVPTYTEMVVQDSTEFSELEAEMDYKAKTHVYRDLREGSYDSLMAAGDSTIFYNFMQQVAATDQGLWEEYLQRLEAGELDTARLYMELMNATGSLDQNNAYCAEAYLAHYAWQNPFGAATEQGLTLLAHQTPYIAGRAVYSARVMLDIDNLDYGILYKQDPAIDKCMKSQFELYPNPTKGYVNLLWDETQEGTVKITVRDARGIIALDFENHMNSYQYTLDITSLQTGFYTIWVELEGKDPAVRKLIVY